MTAITSTCRLRRAVPVVAVVSSILSANTAGAADWPQLQHGGDQTAARYFYLHDRLGSVRQLINDSGNVVKYYSYEPFGSCIEFGEASTSLDNVFMFTGQYFDSEIDEYYLRARQYNPFIGRFTSRDPVFGKFKKPLSLHKYLYCLNAPVNRTDPSGKWAVLGQGFGGGFGTTVSAQLGFLGGSKSTMFFYGVEEGTYNVFWGVVEFKSYGGVLPLGIGANAMFTVGWSENAQRPEDLAGPFYESGASGGVGYVGGYSYAWSPRTGTEIEFSSVGVGLSSPSYHVFEGSGELLYSETFGPQVDSRQ